MFDVVSPDTHGIISDVIPKPVRRGLMLLSKVQLIAFLKFSISS